VSLCYSSLGASSIRYYFDIIDTYRSRQFDLIYQFVSICIESLHITIKKVNYFQLNDAAKMMKTFFFVVVKSCILIKYGNIIGLLLLCYKCKKIFSSSLAFTRNGNSFLYLLSSIFFMIDALQKI